MQTISHATIQLLDIPPPPREGTGEGTAVLLRCRLEDKQLIERAAASIGLSQSEFLRLATIKVARSILDQLIPSSAA